MTPMKRFANTAMLILLLALCHGANSRAADAPASATEEQAIELAPKGKMPGGVVANTVQITADVETIDYGKRTVDVKGPLGNVRTFKVDKSVKNFDQVKKGDQVVIRHTEAIALSVTKP